MTTSDHDWFEWRGMTCCRKCGIIKRSGPGRQSECKGRVPITLRDAAKDLLEAIDHNLSTRPWPVKYGVPFGAATRLALALDLDEAQP